MDKNTFKEYIKPGLVLICICLVVSFGLSQTYSITKPIADKNAAIAAGKARAEVVPEGDGFTGTEEGLRDGVFDYYSANNKVGVAITSSAKSFGGIMKVMVGINADGSISGVKVTAHNDTPGLGTKAMTVDYLSQYLGKTAAEIIPDPAALGADSIKKNPNMDTITGATVSSNGVYHAVQNALAQFEERGGVN